MKSLSRLLISAMALLVCLVAGQVRAQDKGYPAYSGHVNDFANVIDPRTRQQMETILTNFEQLTGTQIAAVTVQSLDDRPVEEYATGLYRSWGIGARSGENRDKGALLLIALDDRKTRLEVGYGLEGDLPDGLAGAIIRRMRPYLQQGDYSQGMNVGVRTLVDTLATKWNISIAGIEDKRYAYTGSKPGTGLTGKRLLVLIIIFFVIVFLLSRIKGGRGGGGGGGLWWVYPIIFNRSGGSFGGGSWGDSGGWGGGGGSDWGGFGGGSSGGGGASDSW